MNIIKELKKLKKELAVNIDISAINLTEGQQYVLDLETKEKITVFTCFPQRQLGQTTACLLKAIQLSNEGNVKVTIFTIPFNNVDILNSFFMNLAEHCKFEDKIITRHKATNSSFYHLKNGSTIEFKSITNINQLRGIRTDYALIDDANLNDQDSLDAIMRSLEVSEKGGQAFFFPKRR